MPIDAKPHAETIGRIRANLEQVIVGKGAEMDLLLSGLVGQGHVLLEDIPGVGKTTLAKALALSVGGHFSRIQFTPDLLPADIIGAAIYNAKEAEFVFKPGPVFANILLADEINRASPRTQSALLEAMAERQVTIDGKGHLLAPPFAVIATQNPIESHGTYPLPEAQLDRFAIQLSLGYPPGDEEKRILYGQGGTLKLGGLSPVVTPQGLVDLQDAAGRVELEESVAGYLMSLVAATRAHPAVRLGVSPRGGLALLATARARALAQGRGFVTPDDLKQVAVPAMAHRLVLDSKARYGGVRKDEVIQETLGRVAVPR